MPWLAPLFVLQNPVAKRKNAHGHVKESASATENDYAQVVAEFLRSRVPPEDLRMGSKRRIEAKHSDWTLAKVNNVS